MSETMTNQMESFNDVVLPGIQKQNAFGAKNKDKENKTPNQVWINVGKRVPNPFFDPKDPTSTETVFIGFTLGVAVDSAEEPSIPNENTKNPMWRQVAQARYHLYKAVMEKASKLHPGESLELDLDVEMRRINTKQDPATMETKSNPFLAALKL